MALQLGALRDALIDAGASPAKAGDAAAEVGGYDNRLAGVERGVAVLTWMVGANITLTLVILGSTFALWSKLADLSGQIARIAH